MGERLDDQKFGRDEKLIAGSLRGKAAKARLDRLFRNIWRVVQYRTFFCLLSTIQQVLIKEFFFLFKKPFAWLMTLVYSLSFAGCSKTLELRGDSYL